MKRLKPILAGLAVSFFGLVGCSAQDAPRTGKINADTPPGTVFRDCEICPEMVVIPFGEFEMGARDHDPVNKYIGKFYLPRKYIEIPHNFAIGRFEITYRNFRDCYDEQGCSREPSTFNWAGDRQPLTAITWYDAQEYLEWLSDKTGQKYRLPSESEWEYVARAGTETIFWWGDKIGTMNAKCRECNGRVASFAYWHAPIPVGSLKPNPWGVFDMLGNVSEWVQDCFQPGMENATDSWRPRNCLGDDERVVRGSNFTDQGTTMIRPNNRFSSAPDKSAFWLGLRVAREIEK